MALGLSGSNGGINNEKNFSDRDLLNRPLEVSYFVNNVCNLKCKHCYVGYQKTDGDLSLVEWKNIFEKFINLGALTFGNVGKEPLLSPDKTLDLLNFFKIKRENDSRLRFGLVTNGTLLKGRVVEELSEILPDYIDVSLDGLRSWHNTIRGNGNYERTTQNLSSLPDKLKEKVFISYTLMKQNQDDFKKIVSNIAKNGIKHFLISPYIQAPHSDKELSISTKEVADFYQRIVAGNEVNFSYSENLEILLKIDYDSQKPLMDELVKRKIINLNNLLIDSYGILFNQYKQKNKSHVVVNYMPFSDTLSRAVRISHDGYLSGCLEMFYKDYQQRTQGNLRRNNIKDLLRI